MHGQPAFRLNALVHPAVLAQRDREISTTHERQDSGQDRGRGFVNEESKAETDLQY